MAAQVGDKRKIQEVESDEELLFELDDGATKKFKADDEDEQKPQQDEEEQNDQQDNNGEEEDEELEEMPHENKQEEEQTNNQETTSPSGIDDVSTLKIADQIVFINLEENKQANQAKPADVEDIFLFEDPIEKPTEQAEYAGKSDDEQSIAPWASSKTLRIKNPLLRLHNEIIELSEYLSPTKSEHEIRTQSLEKLKKLLLEAVPGAELKTFGSFTTELYLPNSDIDLVIVKEDESNKSLYKKVADKILSCENLFENINLVTNAKVPIIKFVERETQINFDISFNKEDGIKQLAEVKKGLQIYPEMRHLLMVMKCALRQRDLHETYSGGIGSFLLFCMILAFLRDLRRQYEGENRVSEIQNITLGEYLLRMFKFYGNFDVEGKRIIMHEGGAIVDKEVRDKRFSLLSPQDPTHDIGNSSFKIKEQVFPLFKNRFQFFTNYNFKQGESTLKYLVNPSGGPFTFQKDDK